MMLLLPAGTTRCRQAPHSAQAWPAGDDAGTGVRASAGWPLRISVAGEVRRLREDGTDPSHPLAGAKPACTGLAAAATPTGSVAASSADALVCGGSLVPFQFDPQGGW